MRASAAAVTLLLALAFLPGSASAIVGPAASLTDPDTRIVSGHSVHQWVAGTFCSSDDPALGVIDTDVTSTVVRSDEGGLSRFTFHFDAGAGGAVESGRLCPAMDFDGLVAGAWPAEGGYASSSMAMECGASAYLVLVDHGAVIRGDIYFLTLPESCGVPLTGSAVISFGITKLQHAKQVCTPVVFSGCTGPAESSYPDFFCGGPALQTYRLDVAGFTVLQYHEMCHPGTDGQRVMGFGDGIGLVAFQTTEDECHVRILDFFGGFEPVACPAGDDVIRSHPWVAVFQALP